MGESEQQGSRSLRRKTQSEKAMNSECTIVKNIFKSNSSPELMVNKDTEHTEEISGEKSEQPSQGDASQLLSLTQNSQYDPSQLIYITPITKNDDEEEMICSGCNATSETVLCIMCDKCKKINCIDCEEIEPEAEREEEMIQGIKDLIKKSQMYKRIKWQCKNCEEESEDIEDYRQKCINLHENNIKLKRKLGLTYEAHMQEITSLNAEAKNKEQEITILKERLLMMEKKLQLAQEIDLENENDKKIKEKEKHTKEKTENINAKNKHTSEENKDINANKHTKEKHNNTNANNKNINATDIGDKNDTNIEEELDPFPDWPDWEEKTKENECQTEKEKAQNDYCMYHLEGRCAFGNRCRRKHVSIAEYRKTIRCKKYENGQCRKGRWCEYKHLLNDTCRYHERGGCARGDFCFYRHITKRKEPTIPTSNIEREKEIPNRKEEKQTKETFRKDERKIDPVVPHITQLTKSKEFMDHMESIILTIIGKNLQN